MMTGRRADGPNGWRSTSLLSPPLREVLAIRQGSIVSVLPVAGDAVVAAEDKRDLRILDAATLETKARARRFSPAFVDGYDVYGWGEDAPRSKGLVRFLLLDSRYVSRTISIGDRVVGGGVVEVRAWDIVSRRVAWEWTCDVQGGDRGNMLRTNLCSDGELVYFGLRDRTIRALSVETGEEAWRTTMVKDPEPFKGPDWTRDSYWSNLEPRGNGAVANGLVYFHAGYVVALDSKTGQHVWQTKVGANYGQLHGDGYHALRLSGEYEVLDARTGRRRFKTVLSKEVPSTFQSGGGGVFGPMVVSDTHIFCGWGVGYLLAFERKTGKLVWHHRATPALSFHQDNYFQIANGRLYTGDYGTMRIYEEVNATDPILVEQRVSQKAGTKATASAKVGSPGAQRGRKSSSRVPRATGKKGKV